MSSARRRGFGVTGGLGGVSSGLSSTLSILGRVGGFGFTTSASSGSGLSSSTAALSLAGGFGAGVGVAVTAQREDVDARTFRTIDGEDFAVVRVYSEYRVTPRLALKARLENLLGERYEEVHGYPAPGSGAFGALEWRF